MKTRIKNVFIRIINYFIKRIDINDRKKVICALKILYWLHTGNRLDIDAPKKYTEKIQKYKLELCDHGYEQYVDKLRVRNWIADKIGEEYLIPVLKVWENTDTIDISELPDQFVIKTNHGAGMNYIVKRKSDVDIVALRKKADLWLKTNYTIENGFELQYKNITPKIYAEKYIVDCNGMVPEYKFLCFHGKPYFCICDIDRYGKHKRNIYDIEWNLQDWNTGGFTQTKEVYEKPQVFSELVRIANELCQGFEHVRVDLYVIDTNIFFSEMTFTTGSGYSAIKPKQYDKLLGDLW